MFIEESACDWLYMLLFHQLYTYCTLPACVCTAVFPVISWGPQETLVLNIYTAYIHTYRLLKVCIIKIIDMSAIPGNACFQMKM